MDKLFLSMMFGCTLLSAISQVLLKQSANRTYRSWIYEYLNWRVILAYFLFGMTLLINTYGYTRVDMKYGTIIDAFTYVFVMILSVLILHEKQSRGRLIGNALIILGILVYTSGT